MTTRNQFVVSFALLALFLPLSTVSAQAKQVPTGSALNVSGVSADPFKDCTTIKEIGAGEEDVPTIEMNAADKKTSLVRFTQIFSPSLSAVSKIVYKACSAETIAKIQTSSATLGLTIVPKILNDTFGWLASVTLGILAWVLKWAGYLLVVMIGQGKFITSDIVTQAWPFVQGLANLGFIFALLYIALATTLRMETVSSSIQRLLPRLLIAALLVNFSLVIGGLIIDASRLVMAAEIKIMGNGTLDYENFAAELVKSSNASATALADMNIINISNASAVVLKMIQSVLFIGLLTVAITIIAVNLFIRYIVLLILLILSPMAYLAIALPKTSEYAKQWWGMFIKWVLYGPIVLFFLIIITRIQNVDVQLAETASENKLFIVFFNQFVHFAIIIALFFVANSVGKKVAGVGSDAVMGFAKKNPRAAIIAGASVLTGGLGSAAAVALTSRSAKNLGRDFTDIASKNLKNAPGIKPVRTFFGAGTRNADGSLKAGRNSWSSKFAENLTDGLNQNKNADRANVASNIDNTLLNPILRMDHDSLTPTMLSQGHVVKAMGKGAVGDLMANGEQAQRMAVAGNKDYIAGLKPNEINELQTFIRTKVEDKKEKADVLNRILKTVQEKDKT